MSSEVCSQPGRICISIHPTWNFMYKICAVVLGKGPGVVDTVSLNSVLLMAFHLQEATHSMLGYMTNHLPAGYFRHLSWPKALLSLIPEESINVMYYKFFNRDVRTLLNRICPLFLGLSWFPWNRFVTSIERLNKPKCPQGIQQKPHWYHCIAAWEIRIGLSLQSTKLWVNSYLFGNSRHAVTFICIPALLQWYKCIGILLYILLCT